VNLRREAWPRAPPGKTTSSRWRAFFGCGWPGGAVQEGSPEGGAPGSPREPFSSRRRGKFAAPRGVRHFSRPRARNGSAGEAGVGRTCEAVPIEFAAGLNPEKVNGRASKSENLRLIERSAPPKEGTRCLSAYYPYGNKFERVFIYFASPASSILNYPQLSLSL
jgi:hypothetical protein